MSPFHTRAAIVSIGDELTLGQALDTNSKWLSEQLLARGIVCIEHVTIADDQQRTAETFTRLAGAAHLIISTGGLGPTLDDLTRQAVAQILGEELILDHTALEAIRTRLESRGRKMTDIQKIQACRPKSARLLANSWGTAPGLHARIDAPDGADADLFCLPGPPGEMQPMFEASVVPALRLDPSRRVVTRFVYLAGIGEGDAAAKLAELMDRKRNPLVGITASGGILTCRVRYEGPLTPPEADTSVDDSVRTIRKRLGDFVFAEGSDTLAGTLLRDLRERGRTLAAVESCTGGGLASLITDVPGSSAVFRGALVTYANELKQSLAGVSEDDLRAHGAVSEPVARAMAVGGLERLAVSHCLSITGIAGPDGGSTEKPVGTVWIAHAWSDEAGAPPRTDVRRFWFPGSREDVRDRAAQAALNMLRLALTRADPRERKLLWEMTSP